MSPLHRALCAVLERLLPLVLLGLAVGLACLPLNLLDRAQDLLLRHLPTWGGHWDAITLAMALSPLVVMPLLLLLQARPWPDGAGSGIPQTMVSLESPERAEVLLAPPPTIRRLVLWSIATLALFPLGREGPVVQVGAAVAHALQRRWPRLLVSLSRADALAVAAAAGLAGGFNTPLMGVIFLAEELTRRFTAGLIWPGLLVCVVAAGFSDIGGQPEFALGLLRSTPGELLQLLWAVPLGIGAGLSGALFARLLLESTRRITPLARRLPLRTGVVLGGGLAVLMLLSDGASGGDGETLMSLLIAGADGGHATPLNLLARLIAPCLALGAGIPGGLIDPAFSIGALLGQMLGDLTHQGPLGLALGMAAALAGATQLPAMSVAFALRLAGDQQLLPGVLLAAVIGAYCSRLLLDQPIYHALAELSFPPQSPPRLSG
ncbi:MAG: chloride channel protein [Cyanobium sp.]